jgi:hypothetical protein
MEQNNPLVFEVKLTAKELWKFSMYHSNKGMAGVFNVIFSLAAIFLLITRWSVISITYRVVFLICALMFTVWQPWLLYLKSARQAKKPAIADGMILSFSREGIVVSQGGSGLELIWDNISRAEQTGSMIIIYMDKVHAYLLPGSVEEEKKTQLMELLKEQLPPERRKRI